jgi:hypothetical protein
MQKTKKQKLRNAEILMFSGVGIMLMAAGCYMTGYLYGFQTSFPGFLGLSIASYGGFRAHLHS